MKKILLTGGGTAGHVTPNIALLPELRKRDYEVFYAGTRSGIEDRLITREGVPFHAITAGKLRRYFDLKNITDLFLIFTGFIQSMYHLVKLRPDVVFSKGGFVSTPVVWAAWLLKIPVIIHESDCTPGLANRLSLPCAAKICYSFPETARHLKKEKSVFTGLPVRRTLLEGDRRKGLRLCQFSIEKPVILVMGGSQGSVVINAAVREALPHLSNEFNICHICGKGNLGEPRPSYRQFEFVSDELAHLFAITEVFVGRSGATTLFELLALKKPSLLIPLATGASRGDQILNARSFEKQGFSVVLPQDELSASKLIEISRNIYSRKEEFISAFERCAVPDGIKAVTDVIESVVKSGTASERNG